MKKTRFASSAVFLFRLIARGASGVLGLAALAAVSAVPLPAHADVTCLSGAIGRFRTYVSIPNADPADTRATCANGVCQVTLQGWVYIPTVTVPTGGFPTIIFNHGSEQTPGAKCPLADYFVTKMNYVLFVPVRRGHSPSTGEYIMDYAARMADQSCAPISCTDDQHAAWVNYWRVEYLKAQAQDIASAFSYLTLNYPKVNPAKVALMGHSYGGLAVVFANQQPLGHRAAIDIAGGSQSWAFNDYLRQQTPLAVANAVTPTFFLQPRNDVNTLPTAELSHTAGVNGQEYQAAVFPAVPDAVIQPCPRQSADDPTVTLSCADVAHFMFVKDSGEIGSWGPIVLDFLGRYGVN